MSPDDAPAADTSFEMSPPKRHNAVRRPKMRRTLPPIKEVRCTDEQHAGIADRSTELYVRDSRYTVSSRFYENFEAPPESMRTKSTARGHRCLCSRMKAGARKLMRR